METSTRPFVALFSDIGDVLGTNGWDSALRRRTCEYFNVSHEMVDVRHRLMFDTYERGFIRFEEYLKAVFFSEPREFTIDEVQEFVCNGSVPWLENIAFMKAVKERNRLKLALISNEGQGITEHRIEKFGLRELADFMVISHFTGMRKPDPAIWKLTSNLAAVRPEQTIYIDDREVFAEVASRLGYIGVHHTSLESTQEKFKRLGLETP